MTAPQWTPSTAEAAAAQITDFARFAGRPDASYHELWQWSVADLDGFWRAIWSYFELGPAPARALADPALPGARWFPEVRSNYVDRLLQLPPAGGQRPAIVYTDETSADRELSRSELLARVAALAAWLRSHGVEPGDRVVGYLPNIPEAVIGFLATVSIGAVWSSCGQDYSAKAALDRLGQLDPVVLITADGYRFGGRVHQRSAEVAAIRSGIGSVRATVVVTRFGERPAGTVDWVEVVDRPAVAAPELLPAPVPLPFDHPLWVVFSSGTTGLPKGIVHGHGGVLLEHLKVLALHADLGPDDTFFWYTSPSWMMWNYQVAGLLVGATIVCYDGSPAYPGPDALWALAGRLRVTQLGASPGYVLGCIKAGIAPRRGHDLSALRSVGITGSTLPPSSSQWLQDAVGVRVSSISGGTDVVTAFAGGTPVVPVWPGELSSPYLGVALDAYDSAGESVRGVVGELVVTAPMPSMPIGFWRDPDGSRYRAAYFDSYPGVWRHGDWITITGHGSVIVHGRSDSTLNRNGIRMGSADIYQAVERLPEVAEALIIGAEQPDGGYWMPLFVVLAPDAELTAEVIERIRAVIRSEASPRHLPDEIVAAPGVPHTRTGKKLEVPIKRIFQGADPATAVDPSAVDAPELIDWYVGFGARRGARPDA
ncbi:acetoacetate--CoA ligase [Skermania piniformis]|uniref:Acetoacetate--CoA ligase n=1 Tax=Skermania pinensis TaxID=39122 RepID=A0ABX8SAQ1_9ACTN|nr:acetoacetate--CoA ligase [Skermania piniformis]QXQ14531.1 acetoacetate--CoA ligase [Skermania piniformis]